ncbi:MAG: class I SAM-dependent methyltransferase [Planctomycetota bacterium]
MRNQIARLGLAWLMAICSLGGAKEVQPEPLPRITDKLRADAEKLQPLVKTELAKNFLSATARLAEPSARKVYRSNDKKRAISQQAFESLSPEQQAEFTLRDCPPEFYYETSYGSPLVYSRVLELASPHLRTRAGMKLLDFGCGTIGQLHLLAHCGFNAHGVDVEPVFEALYSQPGDTGAVGSGSVTLHIGQWPAEEKLRAAAGAGFQLITSKNTLKSGYIHPNPPPGQTVDPSRLVQLGLSDEEFLKQVAAALEPGGLFVIYNICPPQNPADKPYIPWADGKSPFSQEAFQQAGFEVLAFDVEDQPWVLDCFSKLGYGEGKSLEQLAKEYFCWYTIVRKK